MSESSSCQASGAGPANFYARRETTRQLRRNEATQTIRVTAQLRVHKPSRRANTLHCSTTLDTMVTLLYYPLDCSSPCATPSHKIQSIDDARVHRGPSTMHSLFTPITST